jgi:hypothetical protein
MSVVGRLRTWWTTRRQQEREAYAEKYQATSKAILDDSDRQPPHR